MKGDKEFLPVSEGVVIENGGIYKGYEYIVSFVRDHRCGYVAINETDVEKLNVDFENCSYPDLNCHGGVTFYDRDNGLKDLLDIPCNDMWIGFDAIHAGDNHDHESSEKYGIEVSDFCRDHAWTDGEIRTYEYMENECKSIIDQLVELQ